MWVWLFSDFSNAPRIFRDSCSKFGVTQQRDRRSTPPPFALQSTDLPLYLATLFVYLLITTLPSPIQWNTPSLAVRQSMDQSIDKTYWAESLNEWRNLLVYHTPPYIPIPLLTISSSLVITTFVKDSSKAVSQSLSSKRFPWAQDDHGSRGSNSLSRLSSLRIRGMMGGCKKLLERIGYGLMCLGCGSGILELR